MASSAIEAVFAPLLGKPAWHVKKGHGSFITMEFGEPNLKIREPLQPRENGSEVSERLSTTRKVTVRGEWHLWVYCCHWEIARGSVLEAYDESEDHVIISAASFIEGGELELFVMDSNGSNPHRLSD